MQTSDFDYDLPPDLIAQEPLPRRDDARMMVLDRSSQTIEHRNVSDLVDLLHAGDLLVVNDTRVFPARVFGQRRGTGGKIELLLIEQADSADPQTGRWEAFYRASSRPADGTVLDLAEDHIEATILSTAGGEAASICATSRQELGPYGGSSMAPNAACRARPCVAAGSGRILVELRADGSLSDTIERYGVPPVPPYIKRERDGADARVAIDRERYQTVYARAVGAVAAPTAGLHFTKDLLQALFERGVGRAAVTLHVGPGTFRPVSAARVEDHVMEAERYEIGEGAAAQIHSTCSGGGRLVAVGSTTVRTLETVAAEQGRILPCSGRSNLFIHPPYPFRAVNAMLTNFHLPRSTLLMMVSALAGREFVLDAYRDAVRRRYRFYSYGDCMLIV